VANYLVDIAVKAVTDKASKDIDDVRKKIDKVKEAAERGFNLQGTNQLKNAWNQVGKNAETAGGKLGQALKTAKNIAERGALALGAGAGINVFTDLQRAIQNAQSAGTGLWNNLTNGARVAKASWDVLGPVVQNTADKIGELPSAVGSAAESFASLPPTAQVALAAVIALFPQLSKVLGSTFGQVKQLAETNIPKLASAVKNGVNPITDNFQALDIQVRDTVESFIALETGAGSSLQKLNKAVSKARNEFESFNHEQIEAVEGAYKLAAALEAQNKERREMDNLLRRAQGKPSVEDEAQQKKDDRIKEAVRQEKLRQAENRKERIKEISHQKLRLKIRRMDRREEKAREAARQQSRQGERLREGLMLGVGFPLLFGGGPGSILGGGGGALLQSQLGTGENKGKGFGAQIALSAVGGQIDRLVSTIVKGMIEVGEAVTTTAGAYALLEEKSLFSTKEIKERAKALKEQGDVDKLNTLLTKEYIRLVGREGFNALQDAGTEAQNLKTAWEELTLAMSALMAGPLGDLLEKLTEVARSATNNARLQLLEQDLIAQGDTDIAEKLRDEIDSIRMKSSWSDFLLPGTGMKELSPAQQEDLLKRYGASRKTDGVTIPEAGDGLGKPPKDKLTSEQKAAKRAAEQYADKLADLEQEIAYEKELMNMDNGSYEMREREADISKAILGLNKEQTEEVKDRLEKLYDLQDVNENIRQQEEQIKAVYDEIGVSIRDGLVEGLNAAIDGTKTLGEVASSVFRRISNALLNYGVNIGLSSLPGVGGFFSQALGMNVGKTIPGKLTEWNTDMPLDAESIPFKASGGSVSGGSPYIVGEKGPELFVPGGSGNIVPNHEMGGSTNVVVNVDASGSSVEGDAGQAEQLGSMLAAAVQSEIANQQRPGGLLARR
jgi:hypothetical protein|tara:strand:+ start:2272 stop:4959 length:2688 start_codon:yes stop_codon:yes gene_type:complete